MGRNPTTSALTAIRSGNQDHFINECPLFIVARNSLIHELKSLSKISNPPLKPHQPLKSFITEFFTLECELYDHHTKTYLIDVIKTFIDCITRNFHIVINY